IAIVTNVRWDAVDASSVRQTSARQSGRRSRVVLAPRCWRQALQKYLQGDGGNKAGRRGERGISRKTIAQGKPGCLRCPVCSCAHFLCTLHTRPRVQRAPGFPCALCYRGREIHANLGRSASRECEGVFVVSRHPEVRALRCTSG